MKLVGNMRSLEERFWEKVDKNGPICEELGSRCWMWLGSKSKYGHGLIGAGRRGLTSLGTHVVAWKFMYGDIPDGMKVCHLCNNSSCVRVEHLCLGNSADNTKYMMKSGRWGNQYKNSGNTYIHGSQIPKKSVAERFWEKVKVGDNSKCWEWQATRTKHGYGHFRVQGKLKLAHRIAYELVHGKFPDTFDVLHNCDNRACVNPGHLWLGTDSDNMRDMVAKGRNVTHIKEFIKRGEENGKAKLTDDKVREIRRMYIPQVVGYKRIAKIFGITPNMVSYIVRGKNWKHII